MIPLKWKVRKRTTVAALVTRRESCNFDSKSETREAPLLVAQTLLAGWIIMNIDLLAFHSSIHLAWAIRNLVRTFLCVTYYCVDLEFQNWRVNIILAIFRNSTKESTASRIAAG